jgi:ligand-binding sensor domain-containing protein/two-component sensor histidine kinase
MRRLFAQAKLDYRLKILFWATAILFLVLPSRAEVLPIKNYLSTDGLVYDKVYGIYQDSRGFVWFTSPIGISRFDGYKFVSYSFEDGLDDPMIYDVVEDNDGVYWFGSLSKGVYRFDPRVSDRNGNQPETKAAKFQPVKVSDSPKNNPVTKLYKTRKGEIYAGTYEGLFLLDTKANKFSRIELNVQILPDKPFQAGTIAEDAEGSLWIGHQQGLSRLMPNGAVINYEVQPQADGTDRVRWLTVDADNRVWILTEAGRKVIVFNPEPAGVINVSDNSKRKLRFRQENRLAANIPQGFAYLFAAEEVLAEGSFHSLNATRDGKVWLCGFGKGLVEFDGREFRLYTKENGLSDNTIRSVVEDNFGNLWIGSDWGVMKYNPSNFITYHVEDGLGNEQIGSIFQDKNSVLYALTAKWSISRYEGKKFTTVKLDLPAVGNWNVDRALSDRAGEWWFATGNGLYRFAAVDSFEKLADAQPAQIYTTENGLPSNKIRVVFEDSNRDIWFSFEDKPGRLARWRRETGEFQIFGKEDGIPENCVPQNFREDAAGNLYSPCFSEAIIVRQGERFITYRHETFVKDYWISDLLVDSKGRIWVATPTKGLLKIENLISGNPTTKVYSTTEGLSSVSGQFLTEDAAGKIYYLNARALDVLEPETGKVRRYTIADGLSGTGNGAAFRDRSGTLWFGAHRGISRLTPHPENAQSAPPIFIGGLRAGGKSVPVNAVGETEISGLTLESDERQMQIDFFGLALAKGESLRYQYKLEGASNDWSEPSAERTANYPNIPAGNYRFLVRAINSDDVASENPATISFTVLRPVWQRWWFLTIASVLIGLLIYALYRYRIEQVIKLERVRTRIATDLHDDIGSSLSKIAILSEVVRQKTKGNGASEPLEIIANTSREMVDSMSDIVWAINPERDSLIDLIHRMRRFAEDIFDAQDIDYQFIVPEHLKDISLGADIRRDVYLIFKECVNNLAKHSKATEAEIKINLESEKFIVEINDNGRGFTVPSIHVTTDTLPAGNGFGGNGLRNMRRRTKNFGGDFQIDSVIGKGTRIVLQIPVNKKIFTA